MWGTIATGLFASTAVNSLGPNGLFFGNPHQEVVQLFGVAVVALFAFVGSYALLRAINFFVPLRVTPAEEGQGLDIAEFGEEAYAPGEDEPPAPPPRAPPAPTS